MDRDFHNAQFPGLGEHPADQGAGHAQFPGDVALLLALQVVTPGHVGQLFLLFKTCIHTIASFKLLRLRL